MSKRLEAGDEAPAFELGASTGGVVALRDLLKKGKVVVLYFYPRADTPGCTKEACGFRDASADYARAKVAVVGVSPDPLPAVEKFANKFNLKFPLLADPGHAVAGRYGVWREKSMYGRKFMGVARTTFVIAPDGTILHVFENVKPEGHDRKVLEWIADSQT